MNTERWYQAGCGTMNDALSISGSDYNSVEKFNKTA